MEISLSELQRRVENQINLLKPKQHVSFETFAGLSIQNFIDRNKDWYKKLQNKQRITVRLLPKKIVEKKPLKVQGKRSESDRYSNSANEASDLDQVVTDYETASSDIERDQRASGYGDAVKEETSPYDVFIEEKSPELWRQKSKKRVRKRSSSDSGSPRSISLRQNVSLGNYLQRKAKPFTRSSEKHLMQLLSNGESENVLIRTFEEYAKNPKDFALDIVSLLNTPKRELGEIFISLSSKLLQSEIDDDGIFQLHQALGNQKDNYSYLPCCEYQNFTLNDENYLNIEVPHVQNETMNHSRRLWKL